MLTAILAALKALALKGAQSATSAKAAGSVLAKQAATKVAGPMGGTIMKGVTDVLAKTPAGMAMKTATDLLAKTPAGMALHALGGNGLKSVFSGAAPFGAGAPPPPVTSIPQAAVPGAPVQSAPSQLAQNLVTGPAQNAPSGLNQMNPYQPPPAPQTAPGTTFNTGGASQPSAAMLARRTILHSLFGGDTTKDSAQLADPEQQARMHSLSQLPVIGPMFSIADQYQGAKTSIAATDRALADKAANERFAAGRAAYLENQGDYENAAKYRIYSQGLGGNAAPSEAHPRGYLAKLRTGENEQITSIVHPITGAATPVTLNGRPIGPRPLYKPGSSGAKGFTEAQLADGASVLAWREAKMADPGLADTVSADTTGTILKNLLTQAKGESAAHFAQHKKDVQYLLTPPDDRKGGAVPGAMKPGYPKSWDVLPLR